MSNSILIFTNGLVNGAVYAAVALALCIIWRSTRVLNFAQGGMAVVSSYVAFSVYQRTASVTAALVAALIAGALLGFVVERVLMQFVDSSEEFTPVIVTLGLLILSQALTGIFFGVEVKAFPAAFSMKVMSIDGIPIISAQGIFTIVAVGVALLVLTVIFTKFPLGLRLRASAFAPDTARLLGVKVKRMRLIGWVIAATMGALAGALVLPSTTGLEPIAMDVPLILGFTAAVLGGLDSLVGAVVGSLILGVVMSVSSYWFGSAVTPIVSLLLLVAVLLVKPGGLFASAGARKV